MWIAMIQRLGTHRLMILSLMTGAAITCAASAATQAATLQLIDSTPVSGATDVSRIDALGLQFSLPLNAGSVRADTVTVNSSATQQKLSLSVSGAAITALPLTAMLPATAYTLTATSLRSTTGEVLQAPAIVNFKTRDATWQAPTRIISMASNQFNPLTAVNGKGIRFIVWLEWTGAGDILWAARRLPGETTSTPIRVANSPQDLISEYTVKVDDNGNAMIAWVIDTPPGPRPRHLWASHFTAGSGQGAGWSAPQIIDGYSARSATNPHLVFDHAGNAFAMWQQFDCCGVHALQSIIAARYTPSGGWGKPVRLDASISLLARDIDIQVDDAGNAYATWSEEPLYYSSNHDLRISRYTINVGWSEFLFAPHLISDNSDGDQALAVNPRGEALLMWADDSGLQYARANQSGIWSAPIVIDAAQRRSPTSMVFLNSGVAFVAFIDGVMHYLPDKGWWSWKHPLLPQQNATSDPRIVVDLSGNALVAWTQQSDLSRIYTKRYRADRDWETSVAIDTTNTMGASLEELFLDPSGSVVAAWWQFNEIGTMDIDTANFK